MDGEGGQKLAEVGEVLLVVEGLDVLQEVDGVLHRDLGRGVGGWGEEKEIGEDLRPRGSGRSGCVGGGKEGSHTPPRGVRKSRGGVVVPSRRIGIRAHYVCGNDNCIIRTNKW